jgi:hypothetical protein
MGLPAAFQPRSVSPRFIVGLAAACLSSLAPIAASVAAEGRTAFSVVVTISDLPPDMAMHETRRTTRDREWHLVSVSEGAAYDFILTE